MENVGCQFLSLRHPQARGTGIQHSLNCPWPRQFRQIACSEEAPLEQAKAFRYRRVLASDACAVLWEFQNVLPRE
jgi:hypothetical protein